MSKWNDNGSSSQNRTGGGFAITAGSILGGICAIFAATIAWGCFYTVDEAERVVILRNGAYTSTELPGWHFKLPIVDSVVRVDYQVHNYRFGETKGSFEAYSADQQPAHMKSSVTLQVKSDKFDTFYRQFKGDYKAAVDKLITPHINDQFKATFGKYTAARSVTRRDELAHDSMVALVKELGQDSIFTIISVQVENIEFSPAYMTSIEQRMQAEVEVEKLKQNLEREKVQAAIIVTQAQGRADSIVAEAKANAERIELRGNAEAKAIEARGKALADNPSLVQLVQAEKWNGTLPLTMVPGGTLPMISLNQAPTPQPAK